MKKLVLLLFIVSFMTASCLARTVTVINNTSANGGWKAKIMASGKWISGYKYMTSKGRKQSFANIPTKFTIQIPSMRKIGKGTTLSSSYITLREDISEPGNITIYINESSRCPHSRSSCSTCYKKQDKTTKKFYKLN